MVRTSGSHPEKLGSIPSVETMNKTRKSRIWDISDARFRKICKESDTIADIVRGIEFPVSSSSYKLVKKRIEEDSVDISHITLGLNSRKGQPIKWNYGKYKFSLNEVFCKNSICKSTNQAKIARLFDEGVWSDSNCASCGVGNVWNGLSLVLHLDHINGDSNDHRLENLRFLCPNCHSQTPTYSGRNKRQS